MKKAILYKMVNSAVNKTYIGVTTMTIKRRYNSHISLMRKGKAPKKLQELFDLYGKESFKIYEINSGNLDEMLALEKELTAETVKTGLNTIIGGGDLEERAASGRCFWEKVYADPELLEKVKKRTSDQSSGRKLSEEARNKIRHAKLGTKWKPEFVEARSKQYSGSGNPNAGKYKTYLNVENGVYYNTIELRELFNKKTKMEMRWLKIKSDPRLNKFIEV